MPLNAATIHFDGGPWDGGLLEVPLFFPVPNTLYVRLSPNNCSPELGPWMSPAPLNMKPTPEPGFHGPYRRRASSNNASGRHHFMEWLSPLGPLHTT